MTVSNAASLIATLADPMIDTIVLTAGHYILSAELSVLRSVNIEAAEPGTVTLDAQASISSQRRVVHINPGASGFVRLLGLRITGGYRNPPVRSLPGAASASGGGVYVTSGTIDFISCKVYSNTARAAGDNADGGGIFVPGGASRSLLERDYKESESQQTRVNPFFLTIRSIPFQGPHGQTHTHKPRRGVRGRRSQTQRQHTLADAGVLSSTTLVGSLSLPVQMYIAWPAAAVAWPFPLRSPA
jgi:hypothetical protein